MNCYVTLLITECVLSLAVSLRLLLWYILFWLKDYLCELPGCVTLRRDNVTVQRLAKNWTVRGSNPGEGEVFLTRPDRP
jgi:hypothetical protein